MGTLTWGCPSKSASWQRIKQDPKRCRMCFSPNDAQLTCIQSAETRSRRARIPFLPPLMFFHLMAMYSDSHTQRHARSSSYAPLWQLLVAIWDSRREVSGSARSAPTGDLRAFVRRVSIAASLDSPCLAPANSAPTQFDFMVSEPA
eukprot:6178948-Pleurochrysis_carterae.AAC.1